MEIVSRHQAEPSQRGLLPDNRVVFDIKGNRYRMVVRIHYNAGRVYIRFIGTHAEYDKINAETV